MSGRRTNNRYGFVKAMVDDRYVGTWPSLSVAAAWAIDVINDRAAREVLLWRDWPDGPNQRETLGVYRAKAP